MKFPCERYLRYLFFHGASRATASEVLVHLGYMVEDDEDDDIEDALIDLQNECERPADLHTTRGGEVMAQWGLRVFLERRYLVRQAIKITKNAELKSVLESLLTAGADPGLIAESLKVKSGIVIQPQVIGAYQKLLWDLSLLTKWEQDLLFESYHEGKLNVVARSMGPAAALFYGGIDYNINTEKSLTAVRAGALLNVIHLQRMGDPLTTSKAAKDWMKVFDDAHGNLDASEGIKTLIGFLQKILVKHVPPSFPLSTVGKAITGHLGGKTMLADAAPHIKRLEGELHDTENVTPPGEDAGVPGELE